MMMQYNEAEHVFYTDIREKRKAASGVYHKTGKRGYVGQMRFPTDIMSRKEKYNHRKAGKVTTMNIFDDILTIEDFNKLEVYEKKNRMQYWRTKFSNKEIIEKMGIYNKLFYDLIDELNLPKKEIKTPVKRKASAKVVEIKEAVNVPAPVQEIIVDGLHLIFNGTYGAEKIQKQLSKFMVLLEGEPDEFYIELKVTQKPPR